MNKITFFLIASLLIINSVALAQQAGQDIAVLKAGVGARALGMGGAFTAISDNADAPYWNPAGLGFIQHNEITSMQTKLSTDADHYYLSYVQPALGGSLGVSWIQVGLGNIVETSAEVDPNNEVIDLSVFGYFSNAYMLSYGKQVNDNLAFGLTAKYLTSDMFAIEGGQASGYSVTPGVLIRFGSQVKGEAAGIETGQRVSGTENNTGSITDKPATNITIGLKIDDLINQQSWGTGTTEQVPPKLRLGVAYAKSNPGVFAVDIAQVMRSGYGLEVALGYEWSQDGLSFRLGGDGGGLTAGAGFYSGHTGLDYAYVAQSNLSRENVHRVSLSGVW